MSWLELRLRSVHIGVNVIVYCYHLLCTRVERHSKISVDIVKRMCLLCQAFFTGTRLQLVYMHTFDVIGICCAGVFIECYTNIFCHRKTKGKSVMIVLRIEQSIL